MPTRNDGATDDPIRRAAEGDGFPTIALGALIISTALALLGLALTAVARPAWGIGQWFYAVDTVDAVVYGVVAWLLLSRLRHSVAWILALTAVGGGLAAGGPRWTPARGERSEERGVGHEWVQTGSFSG